MEPRSLGGRILLLGVLLLLLLRWQILQRSASCLSQCKTKNCSFLHPTSPCLEFILSVIYKEQDCLDLHTGEHKGDCWFWKKCCCKFDEKDWGRGLHRPDMLYSCRTDRNGRKEQFGSGAKLPSPWAPAPVPAPAPTPSSAAQPVNQMYF